MPEGITPNAQPGQKGFSIMDSPLSDPFFISIYEDFVLTRFTAEIGRRLEPAAADKKAIELGIEAVFLKSPFVAASLDLVFDGSKLNASAELPFVDAQGNPIKTDPNAPATAGAGTGKQKGKMLPMWRADP